ncbi:hypothetical protein BU24DRAFT_457091 [Aaosphaeria arxii CBS 175.79]|uniref:Uncharacterized protein n=1 Tax=Aaosphaeria arxii CBS 175.79 TaxID=1450172 RepID=A0A6A5Y687_9PLEO|nr:uncharacterized protein BU24DRAFT_457091 [Aaosphaeria arxii CBS 175.79]KAF2021075.1 hypothetical protein BU24DRAFT_457091 [Aaosphaeria arxii CBS 175.79]
MSIQSPNPHSEDVFHSARSSPQPDVGYAGISSLEAMGKMPRQSLRRPTKPVSYELANHSKAYLEAEQYAGGFTFLNALLTTGTSISTPAKPHHAYLPPASQICLASTLVVYPQITTKHLSREKVKGADAALRYLQSIFNTVSPLDPTLKEAFSFPDERARRRNATRYTSGNNPSIDHSNIEQLVDLAATSQSLYTRADDFWHIVGWAFNCSVTDRPRWERWKVWLEAMLSFLEIEWEARVKTSREADNADSVLTESLLWHYIASQDPTNRSNRRRVIKAIMAMGTSQSKSQYPEVWLNELVRAKSVNKNTVPEKIDIENGELGDFLDGSEDVAMDDAPGLSARPARSKRSAARNSDEKDPSLSTDDDFAFKDVDEAVARMGGNEAITLRQRLIALLAQVAQALPSHFTKLNDLFDSVVEIANPLPTIMFSLLLSTSRLPNTLQMAFSANSILPLTSGGQLPDYSLIAPLQAHLELYLLPRRATTQSYAANAKISIILEQMFMCMMDTKSLTASESLRAVVERGIQERLEVYGTARGKKTNAHEEGQAKRLMEASSDRLLGLLEVLEISQGLPPQPPKKKKQELISFSSTLSDELSSPPETDMDEFLQEIMTDSE